jgi:hypothetical protein
MRATIGCWPELRTPDPYLVGWLTRIIVMHPAGRPEDLADEELSAVSFVRDYVEFHFDGPVLRALAAPRVHDGGEQPRFPAPGSRDALCALIGRRVAGVEVDDAHGIRLRFEGGAEVVIPVGSGDAEVVGPESAHFVPGFNQPIQVW